MSNDMSNSQKESNSDSNKLRRIARNEWSTLRDLYKENWPKHILTYNTINNYITWAEKNPQNNDIQISSIDDNNGWHSHGIFILEDRNNLSYCVYFNTLILATGDLMLSALKCLESESNSRCILSAFVEEMRPFVERLRLSNVTAYSELYCPTSLYYLPKEKCAKLKIIPVKGFVVKPLTANYMKYINDLWPYRYPGSDNLIQRIICYNLAFGAFSEAQNDTKLCAWVLLSEIGTIAMLHVDKSYRRRGLAELLVRTLCVRMAELGMDATTTVLHSNTPSRRLFEKLSFQIIDNVYWMDKLPNNLLANEPNKNVAISDIPNKLNSNIINTTYKHSSTM